MNLTPTEIEELRACVAEEMGWKDLNKSNDGSLLGRIPNHIDWAVVPPYTTSLDAIQAVCLERFKTKAERNEFEFCLGDNTTIGTYSIWQLTALDWAIAFARTAKIWRYKV